MERKKIKIGNIELEKGLFLAPMAGVTDAPFRQMCVRWGAEYTVTEMVSAKAVYYHDKKTAALARLAPGENRCAVQIFGSEPEIMAYAAGEIEKWGADQPVAPCAIDINMGCPVPKVAGNGEGSALLKNLPLAREIVYRVKNAVSLPVTVKIRTGYTERTKCVAQAVDALIEGGADLLVIHGRTREMLYRPGVDTESIRIGVQAAAGRVPVVGNGDIFSGADAMKMLDDTGCDGVMVARGAEGNPFLFAEIAAAMEGRPYTPPTVRERLLCAETQIREMAELYGEYPAVLKARKLLCWYSAGLRGAVQLRRHINEAQTLADAECILRDLLGKNTEE